MKEIELYIELPARSCFIEAFFGGRLSQSIKDRAREDLAAGFAALRRHAKFAPFVAGAEFTLADIVFLYSADLAATVSKSLFGVDPLANWPEASGVAAATGRESPRAGDRAQSRGRAAGVHRGRQGAAGGGRGPSAESASGLKLGGASPANEQGACAGRPSC